MMDDRWLEPIREDRAQPRCAARHDGRVCREAPDHDGAAAGVHWDEVFGRWVMPGSPAEIPEQRDGSTTDNSAVRRRGSTVQVPQAR